MSTGTETQPKSDRLDDEDLAGMDDEQKRRLRTLRRAYRANSAEVKDNGWMVEVVYLDGSVVRVNSKLLKLKAVELQG